VEGRLGAQLAALEDDDAQAAQRRAPGDGEAGDAAADDGDLRASGCGGGGRGVLASAA
jgi:hypothetical protein